MIKSLPTILLFLLLLISTFLIAQEIEEKPILGKSIVRDTTSTTVRDTLVKELKQVQSTAETTVNLIETDSTKTDTSKTSEKGFAHKIFDPDGKKAPLKAVLLAVIPGGGQVFNRKYWKLPIVYTGLGVATYFIVQSTKEHRTFKLAYQYRVDTLPSTVDEFPEFDAEGLKIERDSKRKNLELAYIGVTVVYVLTGVDAFVDAHLRTFDISDDLSMRIAPRLMLQQGLRNPGVGVGVTFMPRVISR